MGICAVLLQASSSMASQADASLPDFSADNLTELRLDPSPPVGYWFLLGGEPPPGIASDRSNRITGIGSSLCFKFFTDSNSYSDRVLPLSGAYTEFNDAEIDAFLKWSKLSWKQLVLQSQNFKLCHRVAKDFNQEKTRDLLTRMDLPSLVQKVHEHFQSSALCSNDTLPSMHAWMRFAKEIAGNRRFNIELNSYLGRLGVELMKFVAKKQKDVNLLEDKFAEARGALSEEFLLLSSSSGRLRHLFESDGMNSLLDRAVSGRPRGQVSLTPTEIRCVKKIRISFLSNFELSVTKVFAERIYMLDRPVEHVIQIDQITRGPKSQVLYYVCGYLIQKLRAMVGLIVRDLLDPDGDKAKFCSDYFIHNMLARNANGTVSIDADLSSVSSLLRNRELGGGLIYVTRPFFNFICSVEIFLGQRLSIDNLYFYGGTLMKRLEHQLLSGDILDTVFEATFPGADDERPAGAPTELYQVLKTAIVHVCSPPKPRTLISIPKSRTLISC